MIDPFYIDDMVTFYGGNNSLVVLPSLDANSLDACVTDPPYELGFMGKAWDKSGIANNVDLWREVFRVLKPGAHLLAFGGTRTYHRMVCAIEDAGFEIRDQIQWIYGSGFPKSLDISKQIDKMAGAERQVLETKTYTRASDASFAWQDGQKRSEAFKAGEHSFDITAPASEAAKQWNGWGTALKPANEPICLARKPMEKGLTVAQNVLKWGTGAINIDGCRVEFESDGDRQTAHNNALGPVERFKTTKAIYEGGKQSGGFADTHSPKGRFPANVIHDGSDEVLATFPVSDQNGYRSNSSRVDLSDAVIGYSGDGIRGERGHNDTGSAARFFYTAKASKSDREAGLDEQARNHHPTVKPTELMRYLCRLITPPGGTILDPFLGSGSTAKAAVIEQFHCVGIELNSEYLEIAKHRLDGNIGSLFTTTIPETRQTQETVAQIALKRLKTRG